jgi:hypothetical protein
MFLIILSCGLSILACSSSSLTCATKWGKDGTRTPGMVTQGMRFQNTVGKSTLGFNGAWNSNPQHRTRQHGSTCFFNSAKEKKQQSFSLRTISIICLQLVPQQIRNLSPTGIEHAAEHCHRFRSEARYLLFSISISSTIKKSHPAIEPHYHQACTYHQVQKGRWTVLDAGI